MKSIVVFMALLALGVPALADALVDAHLLHTFALGETGTLPMERGTTVYSNTTNFLGSAYAQGPADATPIDYLVADDITLQAGTPAGKKVSRYYFSVANLNAAAVVARPRTRFYADNAGMPGTAIVGFSYTAFSIPVGVSVYYTDLADPNQFPLPAASGDGLIHIWAGETFDNVGGTATAAELGNLGQGLFSPPTIGTSADSAFKSTTQGSWFSSNPPGSLFNFSGNPVANFGWAFIPEPTSLSLLALGGLALLRRR